MDTGHTQRPQRRNRPGKRTGRRARGLAPLDRNGIWHVHGTVRTRGRSIRVRKSLGLRVDQCSEDAAYEECRRLEDEIIAEATGDRTPGAFVSVAANEYLSRPRDRPLGKTTVDIIKDVTRIFGLRHLNDISEGDWHRHVAQRQAGNSAATRERYLNALLGFLKFCQNPRYRLEKLPEFERDKRARNPNRRKRRRITELRPQLIARLMNAAHITLRAQMAAEWSTGARVSSVLHGCRVCDLILAEGREQLTFHDTKNGETVDAALHPTAAAILREYVAWRGDLHDREAPLFLTHRRKPYTNPNGRWSSQNKTGFNAAKRRAAKAVIEEAVEAAGKTANKSERDRLTKEAEADAALLLSVTQHWFRHMLASRMLRDGDLRAAMEQGGWLDPRSVVGYTHDVPEFRRSIVSNFEDFGRSLTQPDTEKDSST